MLRVTVKTRKKREVLDITDLVESRLQSSTASTGVCNLLVLHTTAAMIGTSVSLPFEKNELLLGTWQRVVLIELDGPREREIALSISADV
jgi:thiamine phosphate synthase YjbQ (UPF0047 family)